MNIRRSSSPLTEILTAQVRTHLLFPLILPPFPDDINQFDFNQIKYQINSIELTNNPTAIRHAISSTFWRKDKTPIFIADETPLLKIINVPAFGAAGIRDQLRFFRGFFDVSKNSYNDKYMSTYFPINIIVAHEKYEREFKDWGAEKYSEKFDIVLVLFRDY